MATETGLPDAGSGIFGTRSAQSHTPMWCYVEAKVGALKFLGALLLALIPDPGAAQTYGIGEITYEEIEAFTKDVIDFEDFPEDRIDGVLNLPGVAFGERFSGQTLKPKQDDRLIWHEVLRDGQIELPLRVVSGEPGENLGVYWSDVTWSKALLPIGPPKDFGLGTGALAILFDEPVCYLGFRTAIDGLSRHPNVNSTILRTKEEGSLNIRFFDRQGLLLSNFMRSYNPEGRISLGYMQTGGVGAEIAGVFMQNLDLRGIAIDDVRFDPVCPTKLY